MTESKEVDYNRFMYRPKDTVKYAFTSGNVDYFEFEDPNKIPVLRKEAAEDIKRQERNRVDDKFLEHFEIALEDCLNQGKLYDAAELLKVLKERRTFVSNIQLRYAYLSVIYFSYDENMYSWSDQRAENKINHWMQSDDIASFFLKTHLNSLAFFYNITMEDFLRYTRWELKVLESSYQKVLLEPSSKSGQTGMNSIYQSQIEALQKWREYAASV